MNKLNNAYKSIAKGRITKSENNKSGKLILYS